MNLEVCHQLVPVSPALADGFQKLCGVARVFVAIVGIVPLEPERSTDVNLSSGWIAAGLGAVAEDFISVVRDIEKSVVREKS